MPAIAPIDELAEVRAMINRLKQREARLTLMVEMEDKLPVMRPGWPIVRTYVSAGIAAH